MNSEPINGLRLIGIEIVVLAASFAVAFIVLPYVRRLDWVRWPKWLFAGRWRPTLVVIALALFGRAALLPFVGVPAPQ